MLIALIVVALVAVGLLIMLVITRNSADEFRTQSENRESALVKERDRLTGEKSALDGELTSAKVDLERSRAEASGLKTEVESNLGQIRKLEAEAVEAAAAAKELQTRIESQSTEIAALVTDNNSMHERAKAADAAKLEAEQAADAAKLEAEQVVAAAEARNTGVVVGEVASIEGTDPSALWQLELVRSERTWRTSVAVDPSTPKGPFEAADDPVRLAVEVTAAALREDVGAFISIDWQVPPIEDPARRHLIVRVAQEMLEAAARTPEPLQLVVSGDEKVQLRLEPTDTETEVIKVPQPRLTDDLVVVNEAASLTVTVDSPS